MEHDAVSKMLAGTESPAAAEPIPASEEPARLTGGIVERTASLVDALRRVGDAEAAGIAPMPYGPTPFPFVLQIFVMEAAAHTDDLAMALGLDETISPEAATATYVVMGGSLPVLAMGSSDEPEEGVGFRLAGPAIELAVARRNGEWVLGDPGDHTTTVEGDATALTRFVLGRIPATDEGLRIDGDHGPMFKRFFPGP